MPEDKLEDDPRDPKLSIYRSPEVAARYDERWSGTRGRARDLRKQRAIALALERLGLAAADPRPTVLDVPCGTGRLTGFLRERGWRYLGADAALAMAREARAKHFDATFCVADLSRLPLPDRGVDVAVCIRLMHLIRDKDLRRAFLRELARVSRIGVVVDFRHDRSLRVWLGKARARVGLRARAPGALSIAAIESDLESAGLIARGFVPVRRVPYLSDKVVIAAAKT